MGSGKAGNGLTVEAGYAIRLKRRMKDLKYIDAPMVYREYTTTRVLMMEYIDGIEISNQAALEKPVMIVKKLRISWQTII